MSFFAVEVPYFAMKKKSLKIIAINGLWSLNFMIINNNYYYYHDVVRNSALIYLKKTLHTC